MDNTKQWTLLNVQYTKRGEVFITFPTVQQICLYTVFFLQFSLVLGEAETIFKAISALPSSGPVFTSVTHTHLFSTQA